MEKRFIYYPDIILKFLENNGLNPKFKNNAYISNIIADDIMEEVYETKETYGLKDLLQALKMYLTANVRNDCDEQYLNKYDRNSTIVIPRTILLIDKDGNLLFRHKTRINHSVSGVERTDFDRYYIITDKKHIAIIDYLEQLSKMQVPDEKNIYNIFSELTFRQYNGYGLETDLKCAHQRAKLISPAQFGKASDVLKSIEGKKNLEFLSKIFETGTHRKKDLITFDFYTYEANGNYLILNSDKIIKKYRYEDLSKIKEPISQLENPKDSFLSYRKYQYPSGMIQRGIDNIPTFDENSYYAYSYMPDCERQRYIDTIIEESMYNDSFRATYDDGKDR